MVYEPQVILTLNVPLKHQAIGDGWMDRHLFIKCSFAKRCWQAIGLNIPLHLPTIHLIEWLRGRIGVPFSMEIIILMC